MALYFFFFAFSACVSVVLTVLVKRFAESRNITDDPASDPERKQHRKAVPLLGGWPIAISVIVTLFGSLLITQLLLDSFLSLRQLVGLCIAILILVIGGTLDDKKNLSPFKQIIWPLLASCIIVTLGVGVEFITNPFGGIIELNTISFSVFTIKDISYSLTLWSDIFTVFWLMIIIYSTKLLDGLDGLATGVGTIAAVVLFFLSLRPGIDQPGTALFAIIIAGAFFGFWIFNKHPAKIFLGEGGSILVGFLLGLLAIISGAKIATALLILALPLLDVMWVIIARMIKGKRIFSSDRLHLHFRLIDSGMKYNNVVWLFYIVTGLFGIAALISNAKLKLIFLILAFASSLAFLSLAVYRKRNETYE